ncbi:MAG: NAD(P)/FAD-dependent oxidoreductase [Oscillospiraceae bacterium]|nr:NAD(P)/FAD-dependent oxidoreductase [Oscillospiraceae bacterium]
MRDLMQPLKIGRLTARNRIEMSPAQPFLCTTEGLITEEFIAYNAEFAKGGAAIVTIGDSPVTAEYAEEAHNVVNLSTDRVVNGLIRFSDEMHRYGALASIELNLRAEYLPADLSVAEIKQIIADFAAAARRCKEGGMDMVMVHGGHGHVVALFNSPDKNKRTDEYGCQNEMGSKFARELLDAVRAELTPNMAISYRISGDERYPEGVGLEDAVRFAKLIEDKLDIIHVSSGNMYTLSAGAYMIPPYYMPRGANVDLAAAFKKELKIPVSVVGGINMDLAEGVISSGKSDMVAMIRSLIADPRLPAKAKAGLDSTVRPCIRCMACVGVGNPHTYSKPLRCSVNPVAGKETFFRNIKKTESPKKVVIVGGGPAGLEAADTAAKLGHKVVLMEKADRLGGMLFPASASELKRDLRRYLDWSIKRVTDNGDIDVRLNTEATPENIAAEKPDAVFVAVGTSPIIPRLPGIDGPNVFWAGDADMGKVKCGKNVVIIGAGLTGTETAVQLTRDGHTVTLVDMIGDFFTLDKNVAGSAARFLRNELEVKGMKTYLGTALKGITEKGAVVSNAEKGEFTIEADTVLLSLGLRQNSVDAFREVCDNVVIIGDCHRAGGNLINAVYEGYCAAVNLG